MVRLPVRFRSQPLMPMKAIRVKKFVVQGKGKIRYDRKLKVHYLQLLITPSDQKRQEIILGIDPGSTYDGLSIVSSKYHHANFEMIQRSKRGKNSIKSFKIRQSSNRRVRRSRLRHRPIRFNHRSSKQLSPTVKANVDFRKWIISQLVNIFPISKIVIEDVRFNHYNNDQGRSFSLVEQGKTELYSFIRSLGIDLELYNGFDTKKLRVKRFGLDIKTKFKDDQVFESHCIDSFVLACEKSLIPYIINMTNGEIIKEQPYITNIIEVNRKVTFIEKIVKIRRCLTRTRKLYISSKRPEGANYYRKLKKGVKQVYINISRKSNKCRVKPEGVHSNHPKQWIYINNGKAQKFKYTTAPYGGTRINGKSFLKREWNNRRVWSIVP